MRSYNAGVAGSAWLYTTTHQLTSNYPSPSNPLEMISVFLGCQYVPSKLMLRELCGFLLVPYP